MNAVTLRAPRMNVSVRRYAMTSALVVFAIAASQTFFVVVSAVTPGNLPFDDGLRYDSSAIAKTLTSTHGSRYFTFHYSKDLKDPDDLIANSARYDNVCDDVLRRLQLQKPDFSIRCYVYANGEEMRRCIGFSGGGFALLNEIHTLGFFPIDHESVHILFNHAVAHTKSQFFAEGIVQYFEHSRDNSVHERDLGITRKNLDQPIMKWIVGKKDFWDARKDDWITVTYPISGVFVRYVIDKYGFLAFKEFYRKTENGSTVTLEEAFENTFRSRLADDVAEFIAVTG